MVIVCDKKEGFVSLFKINHQVNTIHAHQKRGQQKAISNLFKISETEFITLSTNGQIKKWKIEEEKICEIESILGKRGDCGSSKSLSTSSV